MERINANNREVAIEDMLAELEQEIERLESLISDAEARSRDLRDEQVA